MFTKSTASITAPLTQMAAKLEAHAEAEEARYEKMDATSDALVDAYWRTRDRLVGFQIKVLRMIDVVTTALDNAVDRAIARKDLDLQKRREAIWSAQAKAKVEAAAARSAAAKIAALTA